MQNPFFKRYNRYSLSVSIRNTYKDLEKIGIRFSPQTIDHIADKAELIPYSEKKNPTAFLLGFYVVENNSISREKLDHVRRSLPKLETLFTVEDIIRYARLITK